MGEYAYKIDLHFCTLDDAYDVLLYELEHNDAFNALANYYLRKNHYLINNLYIEQISQKGFAMQDDQGNYYFSVINQEYSTAIVRLYNHFKQYNLECQDYFVACVDEIPRFNYDLSRYDVSDKTQELFKELGELITDNNKIKMPRVKAKSQVAPLKPNEFDIFQAF